MQHTGGVLLAAAIEARFPGATTVSDGPIVRASLGDTEVHAQMAPSGRVAVALPCDGFELAVRWTDQLRSVRPPRFDDSFFVQTNDVALANAWLDEDSRDALLASRYVSHAPHPQRETVRLVRDGAWQHFIRDDEVCAERDAAEPSPERVADVIAATQVLADRPARWAQRTWARLARELGGEAASRVELAGRPILRVRRSGAEITVRLLRKLTADEPGRLRTLVGAHRRGSSGDTLTLIARGLPPGAWPPANDLLGKSFRVDPSAAALVERAEPSTVFVRPHDVEITFDGAMAERERLAAAIELAARWAGHESTGPYR
jgi:hypothetical protein